MSTWQIILVGVIGGIAIFSFLIWMVTRLAYRTDKIWRQENPGAEVILSANGANCLAFPDEKITIRGNGLLVLTSTELHFVMWASEKRLRIPISDIRVVDTVRKFAGRLGRLPLLHIEFLREGKYFESAWAVADAKNWVEHIQMLKGGS